MSVWPCVSFVKISSPVFSEPSVRFGKRRSGTMKARGRANEMLPSRKGEETKERERERDFSHSGQEASGMDVFPCDFRAVSRRYFRRTMTACNEQREGSLSLDEKTGKIASWKGGSVADAPPVLDYSEWLHLAATDRAFERFGLFSGQVFVRPLRNQPLHCPGDNTFTASNGVGIRRTPGNSFTFTHPSVIVNRSRRTSYFRSGFSEIRFNRRRRGASFRATKLFGYRVGSHRIPW